MCPLVQAGNAKKVRSRARGGCAASSGPTNRRCIITTRGECLFADVNGGRKDVGVRYRGSQFQVVVGDGAVRVGRTLNQCPDGIRERATPNDWGM